MSKIFALLFSVIVAKDCVNEWTQLKSGAFSVAANKDQLWIESIQEFPGNQSHYQIAALIDEEWIYEKKQPVGAKLHSLKVDNKGNPAFVGADNKIYWKMNGKKWQKIKTKGTVQDFAFTQEGNMNYMHTVGKIGILSSFNGTATKTLTKSKMIIKYDSMGVDSKGNIWTIFRKQVAMLQSNKKYGIVNKFLKDASHVTASNTTAYALAHAGTVYKYNGTSWQILPGRLASSLAVTGDDEVYIVEAGNVYKMGKNAGSMVGFKEHVECQSEEQLLQQKKNTLNIWNKTKKINETPLIGFETKDKLVAKCEQAYQVTKTRLAELLRSCEGQKKKCSNKLYLKQQKTALTERDSNCKNATDVLESMIKVKFSKNMVKVNNARTEAFTLESQLFAAQDNLILRNQEYADAIDLIADNVNLANILMKIKVDEAKITELETKLTKSLDERNKKVTDAIWVYCAKGDSPQCEGLRTDERVYRVDAPILIQKEEVIDDNVDQKTVHAVYILAGISVIMGSTLMITFFIIHFNCCKHGEILLDNATKGSSPERSPTKQDLSPKKHQTPPSIEPYLSPYKCINNDKSLPCVSSAEKPDQRDRLHYNNTAARNSKYTAQKAIKLQSMEQDDDFDD